MVVRGDRTGAAGARTRRAGMLLAALPVALLAPLGGCVELRHRVSLERIAESGRGSLHRCGTQRVLMLAGSHYEMGLQHGRLLAAEVKQMVQESLAWTHEQGLSRVALDMLHAQLEPHIPRHFKEEMRGLAEGSGARLRDLELLHAMPTKFHCSGAAAAGTMTADGKLYHSRSLDYALDVGVEGRLQNHALLIVRTPSDGGARTMVPAWAGFLGAVTGMSDQGISVGEKGAASNDESFAGMPMIYTVREALRRGRDLREAVQIFEKGPRTCGFNFIVGSGRERQAVAVEVTRNRFYVTGFGRDGHGDPLEDVAPHTSIYHAVRRTNHFVGPETAKTQPRRGEDYHPKNYRPGSWERYLRITAYLQQHRGQLDAPLMVRLLRQYPPDHPCLHQVVMCPTDLIMWVAQAIDDRDNDRPGAQNQPSYGYQFTDRGILPVGVLPVEVVPIEPGSGR